MDRALDPLLEDYPMPATDANMDIPTRTSQKKKAWRNSSYSATSYVNHTRTKFLGCRLNPLPKGMPSGKVMDIVTLDGISTHSNKTVPFYDKIPFEGHQLSQGFAAGTRYTVLETGYVPPRPTRSEGWRDGRPGMLWARIRNPLYGLELDLEDKTTDPAIFYLGSRCAQAET